MKSKVAIILLVLICLGLCVALVIRLKDREASLKGAVEESQRLSKDLGTVRENLDQTNKAKVQVEGDLKTMEADFLATSNRMNTEINKLTAEKAAVEKESKTIAQLLKDKEEKLVKSEARVAELQTERSDLNSKLAELGLTITNLSKQIASTERELTVSLGDREFLLKELKRMQAEKAELERQFNDLTALKSQVSKLKSELAVARRIEFIRAGLLGNLRGAEKLMRRDEPRGPESNAFRLNVELKKDGGARIVPATNAAAPVKP